jgi:uncharacterized protein (TIGR00730 family)
VATSSSPADRRPIIAVLGSSSITPPDPRWEDARALGAELAARGWTVMSGGYDGLMGAVAGGAKEAGGHTIGLPMTGWGHLTPHTANAELRWSANYGERLAHLLSADVAVALPGGVGTLAETAVIWAAAQTEPGACRLVVVGSAWRDLLDQLRGSFVITASDLEIPARAETVAETAAAVERALSRPHTTQPARG